MQRCRIGSRLKLAAFIATAAIVGSSALAECIPQGCYEVYVEELYPEAQGGAWIKTSGNELLANCTPQSNVFLRLNAGPGFDAIYAALLAAQLSEKKVSLRIAEGSNPCSVSYVTLNRTAW